MRVPENCGNGKAKVLVFFPGCSLKPKPLELECSVGVAATAMVEVKQTLLFEGKLPKDCRIIVSDINGEVLLTRVIKKAGDIALNLPGHGSYFIKYKASNYHEVYTPITIRDRGIEMEKEVTLYQQRHVQLRYTHSKNNERFFKKEITTVIWPTSNLKNLAFDWNPKIRKGKDGKVSFMADFHKYSTGYGIRKASETFDQILQAPKDGYKASSNTPLVQGKTYYFLTKDGTQNIYTKMEVMKISLTPIK